MLAAHTLARSHPNASDRWIQDDDGGVKRCCESPADAATRSCLSHTPVRSLVKGARPWKRPRHRKGRHCHGAIRHSHSRPSWRLWLIHIDLLYRKGWTGFWSPGRFRGGGEGWALSRVCGCGATCALITRTQVCADRANLRHVHHRIAKRDLMRRNHEYTPHLCI